MGAAATDLAGGDPVVGGGDPAAADLLGPVRWRQPHGGLGQLSGHFRAPRARA